MSHSGYDLVVVLNESVINKALAAVFYTGKLKKRGVYSYVKGIDKELQGFTEVSYFIRLKNEPFIDLRGLSEQEDMGTVGIRLSLEARLTVLTGIDVELDVDCGAVVKVRYDSLTGAVVYDLSGAILYDFKVNDTFQSHKNVLKRVGEISRILVEHYLKEDVRTIPLPLDLIQLHLPMMPDSATGNLPFTLMEARIIDQKMMVIALNFFDHKEGNIDLLTDTLTDASLCIAIKTTCLSEIASFWWKNTAVEKSKTIEGAMVVNLQRYLIQGAELILRAITLGFIQPESTVTHGQLEYQMDVELLDLPTFIFGQNNLLGLEDLKLKVDLKVQLILEGHHVLSIDTSGIIPDQLTPWQDDRLLGQMPFRKKVLDFDEVLQVKVEKANCTLSLDQENRIILKVMEANLLFDLGDHWYHNLTDGLVNSFMDMLEKNIVEKIPNIVLSPSLLLAHTELMGYSFGVKPYDLAIDSDCVTLTTDIIVNELVPHSVPMPLYIGNSKSKKLHRYDCVVVEDIDFTHRLGYHCVSDGLQDGYKPCGECLPGYDDGIIQ